MSINVRSEVLYASRHRSGSVNDPLDDLPPSSPPPPPPDEPEPDFPNFPPMYKADTLPRTNPRTIASPTPVSPPPTSSDKTRSMSASTPADAASTTSRQNPPLASYTSVLPPAPPVPPPSLHSQSTPSLSAVGAAKAAGSKVSRMKEMFQTTNGGSGPHEDPKEHKFQVRKTYHHQVARSPPPALMPKHSAPSATGPGSGSTSGGPKVKDHHSDQEPGAVAPSSHVQRFNYTRALFARMEEETKMAQERDKSVFLRRPSPALGSRSPLVSPERGHSGQKSGSVSDDGLRKKLRLSDEEEGIVSTRQSRIDRPPIPNRKPDLMNKPKAAYSEPNLIKAVNNTSVSNTPGGLLWKRRQNDIMTDITNTDKFHENNRKNVSASSSQLEDKMESNETLDNSVFSNSNGSLSEDLSITSAYHSKKPHYPNDNFSKGRSASVEVLNSHDVTSPRDRDQTSNDNDRQADKGGVVMRRSRFEKPSASSATTAAKRLSREEIQRAIERADTYLKSNSTSSDEGDSHVKPDSEMVVSDITNESTQAKSVVPEQKMSQSDSMAASHDPDSGLRSWARYRKQRYSRNSDVLEDKVGDVNSLGSISDTSVSGFRKSSVENLASKPTEPAQANPNKVDLFAGISSSSVLTGPRRTLRSQQQQQQQTPQIIASASSVTESKPTKPSDTSESSLNLRTGGSASDSGITIPSATESDDSNLATSDHSSIISATSGTSSNSRPIPVPRRSAPMPPSEPPPALPTSDVHQTHSPPTRAAPANQNAAIEEAITPAETHLQESEPQLDDEAGEAGQVPNSSQSDLLDQIPPVPDLEPPNVQMRSKAHFVSLEEPEETSDSEEPVIPVRHAGSRKGLLIENASDLPQREDGDGTEHPEIQQEPLTSDSSLLLHAKLPPPPAYPGHSKLPQYILEDDGSEVDPGSEQGDVNYLEIDGLSSTSSESEEEYMEYQAKTNKKIHFSREPMRVFMTYSTDDYDRRNEDIDPVAASAEYELEKRVERMDVFPVDLVKGPEGLGLSIIGMGVGADAGLEKLGIFIKTLTEGGAAQKCEKMQVNDQIIEVDGKSLVGVTQAYAASVLRNTSGEVKFLIGREKDPSKSEVARLIQQSLELDRRREELRRQEQERLQQLHDQFKPRDEVLEHEHIQRLHSESVSSNVSSKDGDQVDLDESSPDEYDVEQEVEVSEEFQAGEATPMVLPSGIDSDATDSSPDADAATTAANGGKLVVDAFDLPESSPEDISPDMESQALFVKLKEAQCKNSVLEAQLSKLKSRLIVLENSEAQKKQTDKKTEEMASRLREVEKSLANARKEINHYQDMMEGSQGQYIALEKKMKGEFTALEKKYHKAKKLIKEYQQREKDFIAERESLLQQQSEKDQQYNALVKSLKDRIFQLEGELREAQKAAGLPVLIPEQSQIVAATSQPVKSAPPARDSGSAPVSPLADRSISSESDASSSAADQPVVEGKLKAEASLGFESVPAPKLLDTSASRAKAQLAANSPRRPPTKQRTRSQDSLELVEGLIDANKSESGLETWMKHDSDNTVKKSDLKKRKAAQQDSNIAPPSSPPTDSQTTPSEKTTPTQAIPLSKSPQIIAQTHPTVTEAPPTKAQASPSVKTSPPSYENVPAPPQPPSGRSSSTDQSEDGESPRDRKSSESGSSSTISQTSYDPSRPNFRNKDSEIPGLDSVSTDTNGTSGTTESDTSFTVKKSKGLLPKLPFKFGGSGDRDRGGGVTLIATRGIGGVDASSTDGGITLLSKKKTNSEVDFDAASTISDTSSGYMVGEQEGTHSYSFSGTPASVDNPSQAGAHQLNQFSSGQITEWNNEHVKHWLMGIEMEKYAKLFSENNITGMHLIALDTNKMKAMGISNSKDRDLLKKKIKELKIVAEKERKQQEKERKAQEKEAKAKEKEQKKQSKKK